MQQRMRVLIGAALVAAPFALPAQARTVAPICVGACPSVAGLRLSHSDRGLEQLRGINLTLSGPRSGASGTLSGISLGALGTGAARVEGLALSPIGVAASEQLTGIGIGGIGAAVGGDASGLLAGGIGAAVGGSVRGLVAGGIGVAGGGSVTGIMIAGIGAGLGRGLHGLNVAGVGIGTGGDVRGITVAGVGVAAGGSVQGVTLAGVGIASPNVRIVAVAPVIAAQTVRGAILAPGWLKIRNGEARGLTVSSFNDIRGAHQGLAIGIVNYARSLRGVQIGVVNIVADGKGPKVLPIANARF
jgi:hypothetical protein